MTLYDSMDCTSAMEFSRQEYWSGFPFPSPGNLPNPGIEPRCPELQADSLPSEPPDGKVLSILKELSFVSNYLSLFAYDVFNCYFCEIDDYDLFHSHLLGCF